ncbi:MAG: 1-deoxy-D-xylulose-5-phosphate reductoisomerase [Candidatus Aminicenantes bacterium]|nr:1-deoxy-D-xylulose-5-phosphate reductoisomerase [Candidatus Aminicenantes bacterium]
MTALTVLGSTGSIGRNTLAVVDSLNSRFRVAALAAGSNVRLLAEQAEKHRPSLVSTGDASSAREFLRLYSGPELRVVWGEEGAAEAARLEETDIVVSAISGLGGLAATIAAVRSGKRIALANKESMVAAGRLLRDLAARSGAEIVPVDSEHSGVFQCLAGVRREEVRKITLTASGGPFFMTPARELEDKTPEEALAHPRWSMGPKVTVDSATMMNKGLELIEARWLFDARPEELDILVHPQSIVHSLVELRDGSVLAQLSPTDMRFPIQYALTHPRRETPPLPVLDLAGVRRLEFFPPDPEKFPLLDLARRALGEPSSFSIALNAANELAVAAFLDRRVRFTDIAGIVAAVLDAHRGREADDLQDILRLDRDARRATAQWIPRR